MNRDPCWEGAVARSGEQQGEGPEVTLPFSFSGQSEKTGVAVAQGLRGSVQEVGVKRQPGTRQCHTLRAVADGLVFISHGTAV